MEKELKSPQYSCGCSLYAITEKEKPKGTFLWVPLSSFIQRFKFMKHLFIFILFFSSYSFTGLAQVYSASNPSCSTNCDLFRVCYFYSNENSSMLRLSYIGPYSSGSYYLKKDMVLYAYDGSRRIGSYHTKNCYFLYKDGRVGSMSFYHEYYYRPGNSYCDIVIEFEPIPFYTTSISIQEPSGGMEEESWHWNNIAMIKNSSDSGSSSSSSYSGSSGKTYSKNDNSSLIGLGVLLGLAAVAVDALTDNSSSSSSSSSGSSSTNSGYTVKKYSPEQVARLLNSSNLYACRFKDGSNLTKIDFITRVRIIQRNSTQYMTFPDYIRGEYKIIKGHSYVWKAGMIYINEGGDNFYLMDSDKNIILY